VSCVWNGQVAIRFDYSSPLSCKVFLGGVPWDISEEMLQVSMFLKLFSFVTDNEA
jgi:hypothetical protein